MTGNSRFWGNPPRPPEIQDCRRLFGECLAPSGHQKRSPTWVIWHPEDTKSGPPPGCAGGAPAHVGGRTLAHVGGRTPAYVGGRTSPAHCVPVDFLPILARNGSRIDKIRHRLIKTARNFDASPAVTTARPQTLRRIPGTFGPFRGRNGQVGGKGRQPFKFIEEVLF